MGTIAKRLSRLVRANLTSTRQELAIRAAAIGAWIPAVPRQLSQMPASVRDSLLARRGDFGAEALYDLIPQGVRMKTDAVAAFLEKRDLSHVESVRNAPELQSDITNVVFERMAWNRARGSENMTKLELVRVRLDNFAEGVVHGAKATTAAAARGAIVGALLELPISTVENLLLVRGHGKTLQEASVDVLKNVGKSAGAGAAGSILVTGIALVGVPVGTMAVPLAVVGGTMYTWSAVDRVWKARGPAGLGRGGGSTDRPQWSAGGPG